MTIFQEKRFFLPFHSLNRCLNVLMNKMLCVCQTNIYIQRYLKKKTAIKLDRKPDNFCQANYGPLIYIFDFCFNVTKK